MEFIKDFTAGLLVLVLMINNVFCAANVTCEKYRQLTNQSLTCTCKSDSGNDITWLKDGVSLALCLAVSGACAPLRSAYAFSNDVSGSIKIFNITIKSFGISTCGDYTCNDGTSDARLLLPKDYEYLDLKENKTTNGEVENITITTGCSFSISDIVGNTWNLYIEDEWREYGSEISYFTTDSTNCTDTCGTTKAEQRICILSHRSHTNYREAEIGLKLLLNSQSASNEPHWRSKRKYKLENCCINDGTVFLGICIAALIFLPVVIIFVIVLIVIGGHGEVVFWNLSLLDIVAAALNSVGILYSLIVGAYTVHKNGDCRNCTTCFYQTCNHCLYLGIASIVLACVNVVVLIVFIIIRQGWCGERFTCLNTVLPVCKDTEARGPPDGKSDNPAAKEKHREVKLLTHKEQTQQHHKETVVNKGKPSGEKHEELSKGQPRALPVPTGNNRDDTGSAGAVSRQDVVLDRRPMPEIPSDRHKRGLSANFNDDHDKPLDDNIVHTLPVVKKPKTALDPMNAEDQSKNADDQPKKKKKKKKDRDTSRSEEMEDGY